MLPQSDIFRTGTFRTAALLSAIFGAGTLLLFAFIYWQTAILETARIDGFLRDETAAILRGPPDALVPHLEARFARDLHRQSFAAIFFPDLRMQSGDLAAYPPGLTPDGIPHDSRIVRTGGGRDVQDLVRALAHRLPDGRILVIGRSEQDLAELRRVVFRALSLGLLPGMALALAFGSFASWRSLGRVRGVNRTLARVRDGHLQERLPEAGTRDALGQLAAAVNAMLDDIERLVEEIRGVGDDIAHDLRTPLTRVRARIERGRGQLADNSPLAPILDQAIADLDAALSTITALLRIGQIEGGQRREGFAPSDLCAILRDADEFYRPLAESRRIALTIDAREPAMIWGDRELLFEAVANLLDNALKFTPEGGSVHASVTRAPAGFMLSVADSGPGIPSAERSLVLHRFYRGDRSRHVPGSGLGLNLVAAILRLHGFHLAMRDANPGLIADIRCWPAPGPARPDA